MIWALALGALCLAASTLFGLAVGSSQGFELQIPKDAQAWAVVSELRAPRVALAAVTGAALAAVGATLQAYFRNALADPYVLGTSGGAAVGGSLAVAIGLSAAWVPLSASIGALAATGLAFAIAQRARVPGSDGGNHGATVLLAGIVINAFAAATVTIIKLITERNNSNALLHWLAGSLGHESVVTLGAITLVVAFGVFALTRIGDALNVLSLGEESASLTGVDVPRTTRSVVLISSILVGVVVAYAGLIGFIGIVIPHAVRVVFGASSKRAIPLSALYGASLLIVSDAVARGLTATIGTELPVGAVTAAFGCPAFVALMVSKRRVTRA